MGPRGAAIAGMLAIAVVFSATMPAAEVVTFLGMCEPSAAVGLQDGDFDRFVVANDEDNRLRVYSQGGGVPAAEVDLDAIIEPRPTRAADLEAAAWLGDRAYWIGSHSRNSSGKLREDRWQLFATRLGGAEGEVVLDPRASIHTLLSAIGAASLELEAAIRADRSEDEALAPDNGGFNIEGMAATADGSGLLIGLRSPLLENRAIIVPLANPAEALAGAAPDLGELMLLDLDGRGIRSFDHSPTRAEFIVVAGPIRGGPFAIYRWSGASDDAPILLEQATASLLELDDFTPEAMIISADGNTALLLSDDGDRCPDPQEFRGTVISLR